MRTIIRYRRKHEKLSPVYWLIVQGHYKYIRGKYIEKMGAWIPINNKKRNEERSVILNKNRIRYWIGEGAVLPTKMAKHLSYFDIMPAPWVPWGRKTLYPREYQDYDVRRDGLAQFDDVSGDQTTYLKNRAENFENMILRRVKLRERLIEEFAMSTDEQILEKLLMEPADLEEDNDDMLRSTKYWFIKAEYDRIERNLSFVHPVRREMLFRRLNQISERGFLDKERVSFDNPFFAIFNRDGRISVNPHADKLKGEIEEDMKGRNFFICPIFL